MSGQAGHIIDIFFLLFFRLAKQPDIFLDCFSLTRVTLHQLFAALFQKCRTRRTDYTVLIRPVIFQLVIREQHTHVCRIGNRIVFCTFMPVQRMENTAPLLYLCLTLIQTGQKDRQKRQIIV